MGKKGIHAAQPKQIGDKLALPEEYNVEQFRMGLDVELEHGTVSPPTNVTNDDPIMTGKIALAHLMKIKDYLYRWTGWKKEAEGKCSKAIPHGRA